MLSFRYFTLDCWKSDNCYLWDVFSDILFLLIVQLLNQIVCELPPEHPVANVRPLRDSLGHTPLQVCSVRRHSHIISVVTIVLVHCGVLLSSGGGLLVLANKWYCTYHFYSFNRLEVKHVVYLSSTLNFSMSHIKIYLFDLAVETPGCCRCCGGMYGGIPLEK